MLSMPRLATRKKFSAGLVSALALALAFAGVTEMRSAPPAAANATPCPSGWTFTERPAGNTEIPYGVYCQKTFTYSPVTQVFTPPSGVTEINIESYGAPGGVGGSDAGQPGGQSGPVGRLVTTVDITGVSLVQISVGGAGGNGFGSGPDPTSGPAGGASSFGFSGGAGGPRGCTFGGCGSDRGGSGVGGAGGAATVVSFSAQILVAGGAGGGGGANCYGCANPNGSIEGPGRNGVAAISLMSAGTIAGGVGAGDNGSGYRFNASAGGGGGGLRGGAGGAASLDGGNAGLNSSGQGVTTSFVAASSIPRPVGDLSTGGIAILRYQAVPIASSVTSVEGASVSSANSHSFIVTFSEAVTGFDLADVQLTGTSGSVAGWILSVTALDAGRTYRVDASHPNAQSGTLALQVSATGVAAGDRVGFGSRTSATITVDRTPPTVVSATFNPASTPGKIEVVVTFSEAIAAANTIDWSRFAFNGTSTGWTTESPTVTGSTLKFVVSSSSLVDGTRLQFAISNGFISDLYGNSLLAAYQTGIEIDLDPVTASFSVETVRQNAGSQQSSVTVNFTRPVWGLASNDFSFPTNGATCSLGSISPSSGPSTSYTIPLTCTATGNNNLSTLSLRSGAVSDFASVAGPASTVSLSVVRDTVLPTITNIAGTVIGTRIEYSVTFSEAVATFPASALTSTGTPSSGTWSYSTPVRVGTSNNWTFTATGVSPLNGKHAPVFGSAITDLNGNALNLSLIHI